MSQVGWAAGCLRCRKANSRGQSLHVLATAAISTSHRHTWADMSCMTTVCKRLLLAFPLPTKIYRDRPLTRAALL